MDNNRIEGSDLKLVFLSLSPLGIKLGKRGQLVKVLFRVESAVHWVYTVAQTSACIYICSKCILGENEFKICYFIDNYVPGNSFVNCAIYIQDFLSEDLQMQEVHLILEI